jgi:hypothetical protein
MALVNTCNAAEVPDQPKIRANLEIGHLMDGTKGAYSVL